VPDGKKFGFWLRRGIMRRENLKARMLRALSGLTQERMGEAIGVHPSLIGQIEVDAVPASPGHLAGMAREAGITLGGAEELLVHYEALCRSGRWRGEGLDVALQRMNVQIRDTLAQAFQELCALPMDDGQEDQDAKELWGPGT
jgi:transcriptional regulator with XRE-family HTH domain